MVSVCIATYNGEKYIRAQLKSILSELSPDDEVIISDDSSSDNTVKIINEIADSRITILENNFFRNPIYNLENALKYAKGEYIFLADQDDIWLTGKVEKTIAHLENKNIVMSDAVLVDSELSILSESLDAWRPYKQGFFRNLYKNRYIGCCMAFHKDILKLVLPFPENLPAHDVWIGLLGELCHKMTYLPISLIMYRRHENNLSTAGNNSKNSISYMISYRFKLLYLILKRIKVKKK